MMKSLKNPTFAFRPAQTQQNTNEMIILQSLSCFLSTTGLWRRSYASGYLYQLYQLYEQKMKVNATDVTDVRIFLSYFYHHGSSPYFSQNRVSLLSWVGRFFHEHHHLHNRPPLTALPIILRRRQYCCKNFVHSLDLFKLRHRVYYKIIYDDNLLGSIPLLACTGNSHLV